MQRQRRDFDPPANEQFPGQRQIVEDLAREQARDRRDGRIVYLAVEPHVVDEAAIVNADFFDAGLDAFLQRNDARGVHRGSRFHLLRAARRASLTGQTQPDRSTVKHGVFQTEPDAVHQLRGFDIHFVGQRTAGRAFAALKTQVDVLAADGFDVVTKGHSVSPGSKTKIRRVTCTCLIVWGEPCAGQLPFGSKGEPNGSGFITFGVSRDSGKTPSKN